jgi:hypothetical protein
MPYINLARKYEKRCDIPKNKEIIEKKKSPKRTYKCIKIRLKNDEKTLFLEKKAAQKIDLIICISYMI